MHNFFFALSSTSCILTGINLHFWSTGTPVVFHPHPLLQHANQWWIALALFTSFTLLVIVRVFDRRKLRQLFGGLMRASAVDVFYREEYALTGRVTVLLLLNYVIMASLFMSQALHFFGIEQKGIHVFGLMAASLVVIYFVKIIATRLLGFIFELGDTATEYMYNILLFNKAIGVLLFPFALLFAYARQIPGEYLAWGGLSVWALALIYRIFRTAQVGFAARGISLFYLILYLCTLEIVPFVVLIKVFVGTF